MPRDIQLSFTGGEISPSLHSRVDVSRYHSSVALMKNWFVHAQGGTSTRAGFEYVGVCPDANQTTRLIPFSFNTEQTYILVFGNQKMQVVQNGGLVLEPTQNITNITAANPAVITITGHSYNDGEQVYIAGTGVSALDNKYFTVANSTVNTFEVAADGTGWSSGGTASRLFELATPYVSADLAKIRFTQSADVMTLTHPSYAPRELSRTASYAWTLSTITFATTMATPTGLAIAQVGTASGSANKDYNYVVTALDEDGNESQPTAAVASGAVNALSVTYGNQLTWNTTANAAYYNIYKENSLGSGIFGFIGEADEDGSPTFTDYNYGPDMSVTPPQAKNPFSGADNYPRCSTYHQQRLFFGGTNNNPQQVNATKTANYDNMDTSRPTRADDAIEFTIVSRQVNEIRHLLSMDALIAFTSGATWAIDADQDGVITPSNVFVKRQGGYGASDVEPIVIGETALYIQEKGARVRDLGYQFEADKYVGNDLSIMAEHLFYGYTITDWCYAEEPYGMVWAVRSDGVLLSLAYLREHQVWGWSQHDTDGEFESVACIAEGEEDVVYAVVKRTINGQTARYVERLHERRITAIEDAFCVDSGLTYTGASTSTLSGLDHLEGKTVVALSEGNVVTDLTVTNGSVTLPDASTKVHIGLPYNCDLETLDIDFQGGQTLQSRKKSISRLALQVRDTRGLKAGANETSLYEFKERNVAHAYGSMPAITGEQKLDLSLSWSDGGKMFIRQGYPLPATILAIIPEVDISG